MRTAYASTFIFLGLILGLSIGTQTFYQNSGPAALTANTIIFIFAILTLGYGFKLRKLSKKGITNTTEVRDYE